MSEKDTAGSTARAGIDAPCSNTGRKIPQGFHGMDPVTGEPVDVYPIGKGYKVVRRLELDESASPETAFIDALSFTVIPPDDQSMPWLIGQMRQFLPIDDGAACVKHRTSGGSGFRYSADVGSRHGGGIELDSLGLVRWGGDAQRGRVLFSMMGKGCALVRDWPGLAAWLSEHHARITRADVAHDDLQGELVSIEWATQQYRSGGFNAGGRKPRHEVAGDWLTDGPSVAGRTLYIGSRSSGKLCRVYEKGKQLGDRSSPWTRVEVEWRSQDRVIPFNLLEEPGKYLAGAYPCLRSLDLDQLRVRTVSKGATVAFDKAVENAKQQAGKLVHVMLRVYSGDCGEVVQQLQREGVPARLDPYSYQIDEQPELLAQSVPDAPDDLGAHGGAALDARSGQQGSRARMSTCPVVREHVPSADPHCSIG